MVEHFLGKEEVTSSILVNSSILKEPPETFRRFFLKLKAAHKNYTAIDVNAHLEKAKALIVLGHSLGQSDYHYFTDFFRKQSLAHASSKHMLITYFQERSRLEIMKSLVELSGHALSQLRTKNRFQMVDLSEYLPEPNYLTEP